MTRICEKECRGIRVGTVPEPVSAYTSTTLCARNLRPESDIWVGTAVLQQALSFSSRHPTLLIEMSFLNPLLGLVLASFSSEASAARARVIVVHHSIDGLPPTALAAIIVVCIVIFLLLLACRLLRIRQARKARKAVLAAVPTVPPPVPEKYPAPQGYPPPQGNPQPQPGYGPPPSVHMPTEPEKTVGAPSVMNIKAQEYSVYFPMPNANGPGEFYPPGYNAAPPLAYVPLAHTTGQLGHSHFRPQ
ncbi:hypothetical protein K438DRAFT_1940265 [Mycena galopus ATCC 62051]|nr:hypothetical protein K438DRAFT_1940265 [Mycena galopus ATCC 62051]